MGDFNINLLNKDAKHEVSEFFENSSQYFFAPYILQPTKLAKNNQSNPFEQNYKSFSDGKFKTDLKNITWQNVSK